VYRKPFGQEKSAPNERNGRSCALDTPKPITAFAPLWQCRRSLIATGVELGQSYPVTPNIFFGKAPQIITYRARSITGAWLTRILAPAL
jgi:hypothetical protein